MLLSDLKHTMLIERGSDIPWISWEIQDYNTSCCSLATVHYLSCQEVAALAAVGLLFLCSPNSLPLLPVQPLSCKCHAFWWIKNWFLIPLGLGFSQNPNLKHLRILFFQFSRPLDLLLFFPQSWLILLESGLSNMFSKKFCRNKS